MSRKKPIALVVVSALVAGLVAWVAISAHRENVRSGTYAQAASLCREGQYAEAAGLYEQLGDYKLAEEWLVDCNTMLAIESARAEAASLKESGKLEQAQECLALVHWKDLVWDNGMVEDTQYSNVYDQTEITLDLRNWNDYEKTVRFNL